MLQKSVSFDKIEVIQFAYCIGDNPSVSDGCVPISIEWEPYTRTLVKLDYFEQIRPPKRQGGPRRFSGKSRSRILMRQGYRTEEIQNAISQAMTIKMRRASTICQLNKIGALKSSSSNRRRHKQNNTTDGGQQGGKHRAPVLPRRNVLPAATRNGLLPMAA